VRASRLAEALARPERERIVRLNRDLARTQETLSEQLELIRYSR
jgi:hypothetical protein